MSFILLAIPYVFQLLCLVHIIRTHRNSYWIWIVIAIPYAGGLAYFLVEILPALLSPGRIDGVKDAITGIVMPDKKFEEIKQRAVYSSTHKNMIEYADALMDRGDFKEALAVYAEQNAGAFKNESELLYRIANARFKLGDYDGALQLVKSLIAEKAENQKKSRENLLYLAILEKTKNPEDVKNEYRAALQRIRNNTIEIPYLTYLAEIGDINEMKELFSRIHDDERAMKLNRMRYNKDFYRAVYRMEKS